jgi:hypothetical protein
MSYDTREHASGLYPVLALHTLILLLLQAAPYQTDLNAGAQHAAASAATRYQFPLAAGS